MAGSARARMLIALGAMLFLAGLLTGGLIPAVRNPRLGLSAHLEGVMNGTFLMLVGAVWHEVRLAPRPEALCAGLLVYGTFANWLFTLLGAAFGTGRLTPIAAAGATAAPGQEAIVAFGLVTLSAAMLIGAALLVWGLVRRV